MCVRPSVRPLNFTKEDKVNLSVLVPGRAQCGCNNSGVTEKDRLALAPRLKKQAVSSTETTIVHDWGKEIQVDLI